MQDIPLSEKKNISLKKIFIYCIGFFVVISLGLSFYVYNQSIVPKIDSEKVIIVSDGMTLIGTAQFLEDEGLIRSALIFRIIAQLQGISVKSGTYSFKNERYISEIIKRLDLADYGDVYVYTTLPEGITLNEMSKIFANSSFENFDSDIFKKLTQGKEGYLFPDTYQFLPQVSTEIIVETLLSTFEEKTQKLKNESRKNSWEDIVIMASIIEKEAGNNIIEKKTVAGILWKRIEQGIPLQVDAPFVYTIGKGSSELRISDLRADGPYNTYTRKGLTPTAIGNPGLSSIEAAIKPIDSLYFFYLHDTNGGIRYGVTYNDHLRNKRRYL